MVFFLFNYIVGAGKNIWNLREKNLRQLQITIWNKVFMIKSSNKFEAQALPCDSIRIWKQSVLSFLVFLECTFFMFLVAANVICSFTPAACNFYSMDSSQAAFACFVFLLRFCVMGVSESLLESFYTVVPFFFSSSFSFF